MDKSTIIARLRENEVELRASGVEHISLFGSYARGTAVGHSSDIDLTADFDDARELSLLEMIHIQNRLADILDATVDLAPMKALKRTVRERVAREAVIAF